MTDSETPPTWRTAYRDAQHAARDRFAEAVQYGEDLDDAWRYANGYADNNEDVIYTYRARAIWMDSADVQAYEDEALAMIADAEDAGIDRAITLCVYMALEAAFAEQWEDCLREHDAAEVAS